MSKTKTQTKYPNSVMRYRVRLGYTQEQLAMLLGCRRAQTVGRMERGTALPGLLTTLKLSAALRTPVEFLYQETFLTLRDEVRQHEERMPRGVQGVLPLPI